jgi:hypothetical protein
MARALAVSSRIMKLLMQNRMLLQMFVFFFFGEEGADTEGTLSVLCYVRPVSMLVSFISLNYT